MSPKEQGVWFRFKPSLETVLLKVTSAGSQIPTRRVLCRMALKPPQHCAAIGGEPVANLGIYNRQVLSQLRKAIVKLWR